MRFYDEAHAEEGLALARTLGPLGRESAALALLGGAAWALYQVNYCQAQLLAEESLELFRAFDNRFGICEALTWLGMALINQDNHPKARACLDESLTLARKARDGNEIGFAVWQLGRSALFQQDYAQVILFMEEALSVYRDLKQQSGITFLLSDLGIAVLLKGDHLQAAAYYREMLAIPWELGNERDIAFGLEQLANVAVARPQPEQAARLLGAAERLREASGKALFPYQLADYERSLEGLRQLLDEATLAARWAQGRAMSREQAVAYALDETPS